MLRTIALAAPLTLLLACSTGGTSDSCPRPKVYDQAFRARLAAEVALMPAEGAAYQAMADYFALRASAAACGGLP